jgi:hypothetical protein
MSDLLIIVRHGLTVDQKFYFLVRGDRDKKSESLSANASYSVLSSGEI